MLPPVILMQMLSPQPESLVPSEPPCYEILRFVLSHGMALFPLVPIQGPCRESKSVAQRQQTPPAPSWLWLALAWLWLALASGLLFLRISAEFGLILSLGLRWLRISIGFGFWLSFTMILVGSGLIWLDFGWICLGFEWI